LVATLIITTAECKQTHVKTPYGGNCAMRAARFYILYLITALMSQEWKSRHPWGTARCIFLSAPKESNSAVCYNKQLRCIWKVYWGQWHICKSLEETFGKGYSYS